MPEGYSNALGDRLWQPHQGRERLRKKGQYHFLDQQTPLLMDKMWTDGVGTWNQRYHEMGGRDH